MPVLSKEPNCYPEALLDSERCGSAERRWWVLYTKARQEKAVARELFAWQIPFYLPLVAKPSLRRGRRVTSQIPIFSGYVFLWGTFAERTRSLTTNRLSRILPVDDGERLWADLRQIRQLIASDAPLTVESRLIPGDPVRVCEGPLVGLEGTVLVRRGRTRLFVGIDFLQQGASVEIDDFLLEPLERNGNRCDAQRASKGQGNGSSGRRRSSGK